jgi:hypothetical protein
MKYHWLALAMTAAIASTAHADDYTLFNPVPDDQMRDMNTERPSRSDGAITLDAGHFQIETSAFSYTHNRDCTGGECIKTKEDSVGGGTTLRIGLTQQSEFQVIADMYDDVTTSDKATGTRQNSQGFGDTLLRYKYNFWGNKGGETALSVISFVKLPTNQDNLGNHDIEGGLELPFQWNFADTWSLSGQTEVDFDHDDTGTGHYNAYVNTLVLGKNLDKQWSTYAELYTFRVENTPQWQNTADVGVTYAISPRLVIDSAVNIGISRAADDFNWLSGFSYRF